MADIDVVNELEITIGAPCSISKAALNLAMAKYNALYKGEGILFMANSPGFVDIGRLVPGEQSQYRFLRGDIL